MVHDSGEVDVVIEGERYPFKFDYFKSKVSYKECSRRSIQVELEDAGQGAVYYYTAVDENEFWVQLDSEIGREYFRRVQ